MSQRGEILELLSGEKLDNKPAFSGLIHITAEGLEARLLLLIHRDAKDGKCRRKPRLTGMPSAALPLDLRACEALVRS
jgi:hypothetical protein